MRSTLQLSISVRSSSMPTISSGDVPGVIKGGQQIDIGIRAGIAARSGSKQRKPHDTRVVQLPFVGAKFRCDVHPVHASSVAWVFGAVND